MHAPAPSASATPRVVIVGAGFAGLEAAKALGKAGVEVTIIDRYNHHLFQPLLYQVATAALSPADIAEPVRKIVRRYSSVRVVYGDVIDVQTAVRRVALADGSHVPYDTLLLAAGAGKSYFGHDRWAASAPGLKSIEDARRIRSRLLLAFERAERADDPEEQRRLMTIAVVGGGPTGVELAGSIAELSRFTLARDFRNIRPETTRILLIEAGERLLADFSEELSGYAHRRLERLGVTVETGQRVNAIDGRRIEYDGKRLDVGLIIWAAGVAASPLGGRLGAPTDRQGRVEVGPTLEVDGLPGVFVLGDLARCPGPDGRPLPGLAQVAKQQGAHLGRALAARIRRGTAIPPFVYRGRGNTAIVGRHAAIFEKGRFKVKGWLAWASWAVIHVYLLVGFENRLIVSVQWLWRYLTYERGARLIAEDTEKAPPPTRPVRGPAD